ncbi:MAG: sulfotransferase [Anaerolineales bacterium]
MANWKMRITRGVRARARWWFGVDGDELEIDPIEQADLAFVKEHFPRPKFFVFGYPRSGTTLLARLLRLHPNVHCNWQAQIATGPDDLMSLMARPALGNWLLRPSNRWTNKSNALPLLIRTAADTILERGGQQAGAHWVGDKTPTARMDNAVDRLSCIYPDAWLMAIVRDGRDAALSQRFQAFIDQPETLSLSDLRLRDALASDPADFGADGRSIFSPGWLRRVASDWCNSVFHGHQLALKAYGDRYQPLRYEDLLSTSWETMVRLWDALGAEENGLDLEAAVEAEMQSNPAASWHTEAAPQLVAGLQRGTVGGWQDWFTQSDRAVFEAVAADGLRQWGYLAH